MWFPWSPYEICRTKGKNFFGNFYNKETFTTGSFRDVYLYMKGQRVRVSRTKGRCSEDKWLEKGVSPSSLISLDPRMRQRHLSYLWERPHTPESFTFRDQELFSRRRKHCRGTRTSVLSTPVSHPGRTGFNLHSPTHLTKAETDDDRYKDGRTNTSSMVPFFKGFIFIWLSTQTLDSCWKVLMCARLKWKCNVFSIRVFWLTFASLVYLFLLGFTLL